MRRAQATFSRLGWTATSLALALLPHWPTLPIWIAVTVGLAATIRLLLAWYGRELPPAFLRLAISAIAITLLLIQFHTFNGISAGSALLALMAGLKLLEARSLRDIHIILLIVYFLSLTALLVGSSFGLLFYEICVCWLNTSILLRMTIAPTAPPVRDSLRFSARLLLLSVPLAAALWLFFPRFSGPLWSLPTGESAAQSGLTDSMSPGDLSELSLSDEVAFRVRFKERYPAPDQRYWRGPVLDQFDGHTWSRSDSGMLIAPDLQTQGTAYEYTLSLEPHRQNWLFALDWPRKWDSRRAYLTPDRMLVQADPVSRPIDVTVVSYTQIVDSEDLSERDRRQQTRLPAQRNPRTRRLALDLRARSASDLEFAQAALQIFRREPFYYTLTPPRLAGDSVDEFLFGTKRGFCEHYASAYAALMRAGGVPARVVTGYQGGAYNRFAGYWIVRQSDAHAWTEIWIQGKGWIRADPTAAVAPERIERGSAAALNSDGLALNSWYAWSPWFEELRLRLDAVRQIWREAILKYDKRSQMSILDSLRVPGPDSQKLVLMLAAALIATSAWLTWQLRREIAPAPRDPIAKAFHALERKLASRGLARPAAETASALAERISRARPELAESIRSLCREYNELRYGRSPRDAERLRRFRSAIRAFKL
jgi:transglutaminase-like putative cysteine protease